MSKLDTNFQPLSTCMEFIMHEVPRTTVNLLLAYRISHSKSDLAPTAGKNAVDCSVIQL
jgi:hypothetical protein